jgi:hypothetical protein
VAFIEEIAARGGNSDENCDLKSANFWRLMRLLLRRKARFVQKVRNPTHGSGWILQIFLRKELNNPPATAGGIPRPLFVFSLERI